MVGNKCIMGKIDVRDTTKIELTSLIYQIWEYEGLMDFSKILSLFEVV